MRHATVFFLLDSFARRWNWIDENHVAYIGQLTMDANERRFQIRTFIIVIIYHRQTKCDPNKLIRVVYNVANAAAARILNDVDLLKLLANLILISFFVPVDW